MTPDDLLAWLRAQPKRPTRVEMAQRYRDLLLSDRNQWCHFNWAPLNNAIIETWSISGLEWIKRVAWKAADDTVRIQARGR